MSDATQISTEYVPDSHLPPWSLGEVAAFTDFWQRRFRRVHDKDGTHNDPLIPHAWAICNLAGGGATVLDSEGIVSVTRLGVGLTEVVMTKALVSIAWQLVGWAREDASSGVPYQCYEVPSAKDGTTSRLQIIDKNANPYDIAFALAAYGLRA